MYPDVSYNSRVYSEWLRCVLGFWNVISGSGGSRIGLRVLKCVTWDYRVSLFFGGLGYAILSNEPVAG